jgi:UDP-glucose 4-epimerase|tara:strand:+ start:1937 stop:2812 length:876 start_codon:yes stop_codon:yes gene_type:complete
MKKSCILFGASGFIGSHVLNILKKREFNVIASDIKKNKWTKDDSKFIETDILNYSKLNKIQNKTDYFLIFSAISDIEESNSNPLKTLNVNVIGLINILNLAVKLKVKKIIFASTIYVNSNEGGIYKVTKLAGEELIKEFKKNHNLDFTIIRYGSVYGPRSGLNNGIYKILNNALVNKKLQYFGSKDTLREYIHVIDAAESTIDLIDDKYNNQIITLTGKESTKVQDLLLLIKDIMSIKSKIKFLNKKIPGHYIRTPYSFEDKLSKKYSPQLNIDLAEGLVQTLNYIKKQKN